MAHRRFYAAPDDIGPSIISLSEEETHHLARVLRLKIGDEAFVFDGCGQEYRCRIARSDKRAQLEIIDALEDEVESPSHITLAQALAKGEKFDFIIQKATELGVNRVVPLATDHADVKLNREQSEKRLERWRRISLEAMKQCRRRVSMQITGVMGVAEFLENFSDETRLVFSERGGESIEAALSQLQQPRVVALIGPEGGWSDHELELFTGRNVKAVTLGPRVLRTETAAIVAVTLLQHLLGDISN